MRAYISFEDGLTPEDKGLVAIAFVLLDAEGNTVEHVDVTSEAHKMAARSSSLIDETFKRVVTADALADVAKLVVEAGRMGILKPEEVKEYMESGSAGPVGPVGQA